MRTIRVGIDTPRVEYAIGNGALNAKRLGILRAMLHAVELSRPLDLIVQEDIEIPELEMRLTAALAAKIEPGTIMCLNPEREPGHTCPQAFIVSDEPTRQLLIEAWSRPTIQSCMSWAEIPKVYPPIRGSHNGRPWR